MTDASRPLLAYADGPGGARTSPSAMALAAGLDPSLTPEVLLGWVIEPQKWLGDPSLTGRAFMAGYALAPAVAAGRLTPVSIRLSAVPNFIRQLRPDVAVVSGVRRGSAVAYAQTVGWGPALTESAQSVVVEVGEDRDDSDDLVDLGGPEITGNIVATVPRPYQQPPLNPSRPADEIDLRIGDLVVSLLPDSPTLQFGPGGIGEGIALALRRPVSLWSGLVTESMAALAERDLLIGSVTAAYALGGTAVRSLAKSGRLNLVSVDVTHDLSAMSSIARFVGCNTALQVGLDGSVNIERIGKRVITSIGGHADFCVAASRSIGGFSVIALRSTTPRGDSAIVAAVDTVSTPRCDVSVVVTEHGIADLRGVGDSQRAQRIAAIAAPQHRKALMAQMDTLV